MGISLESLEIESPEVVAKAKEAKLREKVKDLLPVAAKIQEAQTRVTFTLETEGANAELERLRTAANLQGFSLRILTRVPDGVVTRVTVKAGKLIERDMTKGDKEATEEAPVVDEVANAPVRTAKPGAKSGK